MYERKDLAPDTTATLDCMARGCGREEAMSIAVSMDNISQFVIIPDGNDEAAANSLLMEKMESELSGLWIAAMNANDGKNLSEIYGTKPVTMSFEELAAFVGRTGEYLSIDLMA